MSETWDAILDLNQRLARVERALAEALTQLAALRSSSSCEPAGVGAGSTPAGEEQDQA